MVAVYAEYRQLDVQVFVEVVGCIAIDLHFNTIILDGFVEDHVLDVFYTSVQGGHGRIDLIE